LDLLTILILLFSMGGIILAFLVGFYLDPYKQVKLRRQFLKQDYGIAKLLSKDGRSFQTKIINLQDDTFEIGDMVWFSKKGFVYREGYEHKGFDLVKVASHTEDNVPTVYLDSTSLKPISLHVPDTKQTPKEMAAWLRTYIQIQVSKGLVGEKRQKQMIIIVLIICLALAGGVFFVYSVSASTLENTDIIIGQNRQIIDTLNAVHGVNMQNGTLVFGGGNG